MIKIIFIYLLVISSISAQLLPAINSKGGAVLLPKGKLKIGIKYINLKKNYMFNNTNQVTNNENLIASANINIFGFTYGLTHNSNLRIAIPLKDISASAELGKDNISINNCGIGDIIIMGRYLLIDGKTNNFQLTIGGGIKLPIGSTNNGFKEAPSFAKGLNTPLPTQLGTGEFEYKAELALSKVIDSDIRVDFNTIYTYRPKAKYDYDFGNELSYDLSFTNAISKNINLGIEYNGKYNSKTDMGNDTNSILRSKLPFKAFSGTVGYLTPQIEYLPFDKPKVHIGLGISFLAHYNVGEYQPLDKKRIILRIGYLY